MRVEVVQAVVLVGALFAVAPFVTPASVPPGELAHHAGQRVLVSGVVVEVEPSGEVVRAVLEDGGERGVVLDRGEVPALGSRVSVLGDVSTGREGAVLWADAWVVVEEPERSPRSVSVVLEEAPRLAGSVVAAVGVWDGEQEALVANAGGGGLPVGMRSSVPPRGEVIVAWGVLSYVPREAGYRLDAVGWEAWR